LAIFDAFNDEKGREAHLRGNVAKELMAEAPHLFVKPRKPNGSTSSPTSCRIDARPHAGVRA
jgi:hypothetical protein